MRARRPSTDATHARAADRRFVSRPARRVVCLAASGIGMQPISDLVAPDGTVVERYLGAVDAKMIADRIVERVR